MKASEVLKRYAAGKRNFHGENLRGQSFKGQDLSGANFSEADIRSANFTRANLTKANFTGAKCGLQKRWAIFLTLISWVLAGISGLLSIFIGFAVSLIVKSNTPLNQIAGWASLMVLILFLIVTLRRGVVAGAVAVVLAGAVAVVLAVPGSIGIAFMGAGAATVPVAIATAVAITIPVTGARTVAILLAIALLVARVVGGQETLVIAAIGAILLVGAIAGIYIGWRALQGDKRDAWLCSFAIAFAAIGGTSFRGANLTNANFSSAKLKSTDLRKANLTGVRWYKAKMLDRVRPGNTYLKNTQVRQWLIGEGQDKNFDRQDLRGINLQGADLKDASFIGADLSEANLQDTDLSRTKLVQTQLDKTDFTGATLTGAFIEDWGITTHTKLEEIKCKWVFMRLPTKENPNPRRKPDNESENFEGNDFADFIKPIQDTLDLYHNQGVDPRAIAISWKKLVENNPDAKLQFAAMEVKGQDNLLLRFKTALEADLSRLNAEYFNIYNHFKGLADAESEKRIAEKDDRIQQLEKFVMTGLQSSKFHIEGKINMSNDYSRTQNISNSTIDNSGAGAFNLGDLSGTVANSINQLPNFDNKPEKQELKELLSQLQTAVLATELDEEEKAESLEQIQKIASSLNNSQDGVVKKTVKTAMRVIRGIAAGLSPTASMVTICNKLPGLIDKIFN